MRTKKAIRLTPLGAKVAIAIQELKATPTGIAIPDHGIFEVSRDRAENRATNAAREGRIDFADMIMARRDMVDGYLEARPLTDSRPWKYGVIVGVGPESYDVEFGDIVFVNIKRSSFWNGLSGGNAAKECGDDENVLLCDTTMTRELSIAPTSIMLLNRNELAGGLIVASWAEYATPVYAESAA